MLAAALFSCMILVRIFALSAPRSFFFSNLNVCVSHRSILHAHWYVLLVSFMFFHGIALSLHAVLCELSFVAECSFSLPYQAALLWGLLLLFPLSPPAPPPFLLPVFVCTTSSTDESVSLALFSVRECVRTYSLLQCGKSYLCRREQRGIKNENNVFFRQSEQGRKGKDKISSPYRHLTINITIILFLTLGTV